MRSSKLQGSGATIGEVTGSQLLILNATFQILVSSVLGLLLLIPMQPWGRGFFKNVKNRSDLRSTHIDWLLLALLQFGIAFGIERMPIPQDRLVAGLFIFGGWMNAMPYLVRGLWGIDAFSLSGSIRQKCFATLGFISVCSLILALSVLLFQWSRALFG